MLLIANNILSAGLDNIMPLIIFVVIVANIIKASKKASAEQKKKQGGIPPSSSGGGLAPLMGSNEEMQEFLQSLTGAQPTKVASRPTPVQAPPVQRAAPPQRTKRRATQIVRNVKVIEPPAQQAAAAPPPPPVVVKDHVSHDEHHEVVHANRSYSDLPPAPEVRQTKQSALRAAIGNDLIDKQSLRKAILLKEIIGTPLGARQ